MVADIVVGLLRSGLAISLATIVVLALRQPLRALLGARVAHALWLLPPMAALAALLPEDRAPALAAVVRSVGASSVTEAVGNAIATAPQAQWSSILVASWLLGAMGTLFVFATRQMRFNRCIRRREGRPWDEVVGHGPAVAGLLRQRIVLPSDFGWRYSADERELVLAHEQTHLLRGDVHAQTLATALRCVFWFNPLLHFAAPRFRFDQELACDAAVLARFPSSASRRCYGEAMLKTQMAEFGAPIGCHWQSCHPLKERINMLKKPLPGALRRVWGTILVAGLVFTGSLTAWAAQPASHRTSHAVTTDAAEISTPIPAYPTDALAKKLHGTVVLVLRVGVDGKVHQMKVEKSSAVGELDQAAMAAAKEWTFHPSTSNGKPVAHWVRVPVKFTL